MNQESLFKAFLIYLGYKALTLTFGCFVAHDISVSDFMNGLEAIGTAIAALMVRSLGTQTIDADTVNIGRDKS